MEVPGSYIHWFILFFDIFYHGDFSIRVILSSDLQLFGFCFITLQLSVKFLLIHKKLAVMVNLLRIPIFKLFPYALHLVGIAISWLF